mmetsp:Transcript_63379/g.177362  ORF Transcript_63379/g.177362 Transcript_63379/m.177362 type:complete len:443 (-) Transcript_63379:150-1478(-)
MVGGQRHGRVPRADLVHEAEPRVLVHGALQRVPVLASQEHVLPHVFHRARAVPHGRLVQEVLVFAHEAEEGRLARDEVLLLAELDLHQVRRERGAVVQLHPVVEARRAVQANVKHPGAKDPRGLPELRVLRVLGQEEREDEDLGEVSHETLVLAAAETAGVSEDVPSQELCRDVLDGLARGSGHASGHKVPARRAGGGRCADAHGHLGEALAGHGAGVAVVVAARGEVSLCKLRPPSRLAHLLHVCARLALGGEHKRSMLPVLQARIGCARRHQVPQRDPELPRQRRGLVVRRPRHRWNRGAAVANRRVENAREAVLVALGIGAEQGLGSDEADLPPRVADVLPVAQLVAGVVLARPWHWNFAAVVGEGVRPAQQLVLDPICDHLLSHHLPIAAAALPEAAVRPTRGPRERDLHGLPCGACGVCPGEGLRSFRVREELALLR